MGFNIEFDYRFDSNGFFDSQAARDALERAGEIWEGFIQDEFDDVAPGQTFSIRNPSNSSVRETIVLDRPIDDLLVFVGSEELGGNTLGRGGFSGTDIGGDIYDTRIDNDYRGTGPVTNFEPWVGVMRFDISSDWSFALDAPQAGQFDFITVALHEIGHILGLGTAEIFEQIAQGGFDGPNALNANGGVPVPVEHDLVHVEEGHDDNMVLMDPTTSRGSRLLPSQIDLALLADIGYETTGFTAQGSTPALATNGADITIFGREIADVIDGLGGTDQIQGEGGNDILIGGAGNDTLFGQEGNDRLVGGADNDQMQGGDGNDTLVGTGGADTLFGGNGTDVFELQAGGGSIVISDFDLNGEVIHLVGSGFATAQEAALAVTKDFSNVSRLTFSDGSFVRVFHDSQTGTPLTADHFRIGATETHQTLYGQSGNDALRGAGGDDTLFGFDGADTLSGGAGDDSIEGGATEADLRDVVFGGAGNDTIDGGFGNDELRGDAGNDQIAGDFGADTVIGGAGNDTLTGSAFSDLVFGGDGNDFVNGGFGHDRVNGGNGADRFFHIGIFDHGSDWIQDYDASEGDVLMFGINSATRSQFQINTTHTTSPDGERSGDDNVEEAFVIYRPTGQIMWALVDGAGQDSVNIQIAGQVFDLMA
ncbi:matrixin family metalloprotease [Shimia sp. SDUM112013]|uniref:matrixin family metalloprotease n=1 Tax=Shimia sp. SDUM112013 TaxID=3136160 RepID=UPI0032EC4F32